MTENSSKAAGNPKNPPKAIPIDQVQQIVVATENRAHYGTTLLNIFERFKEDLTVPEQTVMITHIQMYYPWFMQEQQIIRNPRNDDNDGGHQAGAIADDEQTAPEELELEENALDLSDEELAEIYPQYSTEPAKASTEE